MTFDTNQEAKEHQVKVLINEPVAMAKQRLMDFAASLPTTGYDYDSGEDTQLDEVSYTELIDRARAFQEHGEYWNEGPRFDGQDLYSTFWEDYALVTGEKVTDTYGFFSCAC